MPMQSTAKQLREKRAGVLVPISKRMDEMGDLIIKEGRKFSEAEQAEWDKLDTDARKACEELDPQIRACERSEELGSRLTGSAGDPDVGREDIDGRFSNPPEDRGGARTQPERDNPKQITDETRALALQAWMRCNSARRLDPTDEQGRACKLLNMNPRSGEFVIRLHSHGNMAKAQRDGWGGGYGRAYTGAEERALSALVGSTGGFLTAPASMVNQLEINMLAFGGMLQASEVIRTAGGERMSWPTVNDTTNSGRQIGESGAVTSTAQPSAGRISWDAYKFTSDEILCPYELLEDSAFDLSAVIGGMLGERLGRVLNTKFTTGSGAETPRGLVTAASAGKTTASGTAIAWDEITDLIHTIDPAYRQTGCAFMFNDGIYQHLRKLKDGMGRPLWADGPNSIPPASLQGYPYFINQDMQATVATGTVTMVFGQLKKYKIRQVNEIRMYRLVERFRENDQDAFLAFVRADGNLLEAGTAPVKKMTQA